MILLGLLALIYFFATSLTWALVQSWRICRFLTQGALLAFVLDIIVLFVSLLATLLGLNPWHFVTLRKFCNPSSGV
jgi:hypothetical protein